MMRKVYFDNSEQKCVSVYMKDAKVMPAGVSVYAMPVSAKHEEYERYAREYDIHFIFKDHVPEADFYCVPLVDIFATDSSGGFLGTVGCVSDFESEANICYINKEKKCYIVAESGKELLKQPAEWKKQMIFCDEVKIYTSKIEAEAQHEFIIIDEKYKV